MLNLFYLLKIIENILLEIHLPTSYTLTKNLEFIFKKKIKNFNNKIIIENDE